MVAGWKFSLGKQKRGPTGSQRGMMPTGECIDRFLRHAKLKMSASTNTPRRIGGFL